MKLSSRDAPAYFRKPDPSRAGLLIFGEDAMRVATRRQEVLRALLGENAEAEMRLTRMSGADLRKDPALLLDAVKAQGFFPGPRAAFVEEATDGLAPVVAAALGEWKPGDATILVTAGQLTAKSALRKAFEGHSSAYAVGLYDDPPGREEIETALRDAGLTRLDGEAMSALLALSRQIDPGDFRQTVEKLGLYKRDDPAPLTPADIAACAPQSTEADLSDILALVADGRTEAVGPMLARLYAQGVDPVRLCIETTRHFRALHVAACDPGGPAAGVGRLRPPVFGPRRDAIVRQAGQWGRDKLEQALRHMTETDLQVRSSSKAPPRALVERALIRLAVLSRR